MNTANIDRVSIIVIARNEPFIKYTLKSLKLQSVKPYEVIVVVDSQTDISAKIAERFADELPIKVVINDVKPGYGGARKKGCEVARGNVIAFIDADTIAPPWWIRRVIENLQESPVVAGSAVSIQKSEVERLFEKLLNLSEPNKCDKRYVNFAPTQNFAFKREVLSVVGNFDENFDIGGEDYDLCLRLKKIGLPIIQDPCNYVFHVEHKMKLKKAWRDGKARAKIFLKHGVYVIRDATICFFHGLILFALPATITLTLLGSIVAIPFIVLTVMSLAHRLYRALVWWREGNAIHNTLIESLKIYASHIAFVIEVFKKVFRAT